MTLFAWSGPVPYVMCMKATFAAKQNVDASCPICATSEQKSTHKVQIRSKNSSPSSDHDLLFVSVLFRTVTVVIHRRKFTVLERTDKNPSGVPISTPLTFTLSAGGGTDDRIRVISPVAPAHAN